ncbi:MAG: adenylate/guanylate cyclase domain-containing protein [Verrucomicrobiales bacterium]|nr:adenylate/guanylate cyclase domain-containing protein [Verrucomicrobiales bacterium]
MYSDTVRAMRLKFQAKLMLAMALVIALVTVLVIASTEDKVRKNYSRLAEGRFEVEVEAFLVKRKQRLDGQRELLQKVASAAWVREHLAEGSFEPSQMAKIGSAMEGIVKDVRLAGGSRSGLSDGEIEELVDLPVKSKRLFFLIDRTGRMHPVGNSRFRRRVMNRDTRKQLQVIEDFNEAKAGYLVVELDGQGKHLVEVVVSPVRSEEGDALLGAVLLGQLLGSVEEGGGEAVQESSLYSGVMTEGEIFSENMSVSMKAAIKVVLDEGFFKNFDQRIEGGLQVVVEGVSFRVFCERLNDAGNLPPSYEVVLYPLTQLESDLRDLRLKGSGVATGAVWLGMLLAWIMARRFARPIREMSAATKKIREGDYDVNIPVRSKDEVGDLARSFNEMAEDLKTKEQIRDVLGKVADEAVAEALISGSLELGGEMREVSILFCDIRGFSALSETMQPTDVIDLLNAHMTAMTRIVYEHRGVVDKFIGDEIMAVFGAPKAYGDDAENAARCAVKMLEERQHLNEQMQCPIGIGIGIATGSVVVGCIGSMDRLNYTVIGERVNRAARLCGLAARGQAVVDEVTWQAVADFATGSEIEKVNLRGYAGEVRAYLLEEVGGASGKALL